MLLWIDLFVVLVPRHATKSYWLFTEKLKIIVPLKDTTVKEQQEVVFNCEVNTEGAKAKWFRNEEAIFDSSKYIILQKDLVYTLRIRDARLDDQANYNVSLTNHRGENVKSAANLIVEGMWLRRCQSIFPPAIYIMQTTKFNIIVLYHRRGRP